MVCKINDIDIFYYRAGNGEPLIFLHGNGEGHIYFTPQLEYFSVGFDCIAIDTRGQGKSTRGNAPFTINQFACDLNSFMDKIKIESADIIGFSDGGNIAITFALMFPKKVKKLVLCGANIFPGGLQDSVLVEIQGFYKSLSSLQKLSKKYFYRRELLDLMVNQPQLSFEEIAHITAPCLVIAGTDDVIKAAHTKDIARALPNSRLCFIDGSHTVSMDNPTEFNRVVENFLIG